MTLPMATQQRLMILVVIALAMAYLGVLRPLARRVLDEDTPLRQLRQDLTQATLEAGLPRGTDFAALSNRLSALRSAYAGFTTAEREALPRLDPPPELQRRLEEPFQFVEFLNESQRRVEQLTSLAQSAKVKLTPGLARGFPSYQADLATPELLWVQLAVIHRVVRTAIQAGVTEIREISVAPLPLAIPATEPGSSLPPPSAAGPPSPDPWHHLRLHLSASGSVDALVRLLLGLALTPEELEALRLPADLGERPALFLDHLLLRREQVESAEQAELDVVISTLIRNDFP